MSDDRERPTSVLDPKTMISSWPLALATLEQLGTWAVYAVRLGTLALLQDCVKRMALEDAHPNLIVEAQTYLDALRHMPFDTK